ncbi:MAG: hypothetical protein WB696_31840 [Chthoniobacterales bacterium]|jgi:Flp pilus assembly protein TadB
MQGADPRIVGWWRDFQYPSRWRYPDLAPQQVLACRQFKLELATESELKRAAWLWHRRPRLILGYGALSYVLMVACTTMAMLVPVVGILCAAACLGIWVLVIAADTIRYVRWRRDYETALDRLLSFSDLL